MKTILPFLLSAAVIFCFNIKIYSQQLPGSINRNNIDGLIKNDFSGHSKIEKDNTSPGIPEEQLKNFLDENGLPLIRKDNIPDTSGSDSFQEYTFTGQASADYFGYSAASAGDVNADGYDDIIIGAPFNDAGNTDAGRAYIYLGGPVTNFTVDVLLTGTHNTGRFGISVSSAGDVNNDGYDDVIVGATGVNSNTGAIYIFYGANVMDNVPDVSASIGSGNDLFGNSVAACGDVNGDGFTDVIAGAYGFNLYTGKAYLFFGSSSMDNIPDLTFSSGDVGSGFGISVAGAGDVNSDGFSDVVAGQFNGPSFLGKAYVYLGSAAMDNVSDVTLTGITANDYFGSSVSSSGDVNADGYDDVIVGAFDYNFFTGAAFIFYGGSVMNNTPDVTLNGAATGDRFGCSVSGAGDVNGDGYDDVIAGARFNTSALYQGSAYVFFGSSNFNNVPDAVFNGSGTSDQFGFCVASAGDFNNDGYSDLMAGAPYADDPGPDDGKAWLYTNTRNYQHIPLAAFSGFGGMDYFGLTSEGVGDVNGDGYDDLMVTSLNYETVFFYYGGKLIDNNADLFFFAPVGAESFGNSVSKAGDLNGDGYDDVLIGAEGHNSNTGRVYVYFGSAVMDNVPDLILSGQVLNSYFGTSVSYAGDVNSDLFADIIVGSYNTGSAFIFYGGFSMNNIPDVTLTGAGGYFGYSVTDAGDINGDSFDDVAVGAYLDAGGLGKIYIFHGGFTMDNIADVTITGNGLNNKLGIRIANAGDVNADGYPDLIAAASVPDWLSIDSRGQVNVFYGGQAMDVSPDLTMTGLDQYYQLGTAVSSAGDYNRDGYDDFMISAYPAKKVYFYFGGPVVDNVSDMNITGEKVNTTIYFGMSASYAGDVNGDGNPDIIAGGYNINIPGYSYIFTYTNTSIDITDEAFYGQAGFDWFGYSVASAGDVNLDGFSDIIIGARKNDAAGTDAGRAYIYFGGNPMDYIPDVILNGVSPGDEFGFSVASAGDVNADLYGDVIVGAPLNDAAGSNAGRAYIFYGGFSMDNVPDVILTGQGAGDQFGFRVASAGNFNGDNIGDIWGDVIVGALYNDAAGTDAGRAYVYFGNYVMVNTPDIIISGEAAGDILGVSVASAGDVNGDSFGDLIIGASRNDVPGSDFGRAYILFGGPLPDNSPDIILNGSGTGDSFGYSVASAGDYNADGYSDVLVGAYANDQSGTDAGRAYLFLGGASMNNTADMNFYGEASFDYFGVCVSSAGDVNADGYSDIVIGAEFNDAGGLNAGRAYVFFGTSYLNNSPDIIMTGKTQDYFGWFVAKAGDINADGKSDLIIGAYQNSDAGTSAGKARLFISSYPANHSILTLKMILQGFYNPSTDVMSYSDTVKVNLRNSNSPYNIIDNSKAVINKVNFTSAFYFNNAPTGNYFIDIRHRNSIETWSASLLNMTRNINTNYDLTLSPLKAYGSNLTLADNSPVRYAVYGGDVNQDGVVDATDALLVDNDIAGFVTGYVVTDINGDFIIDASDALLVDNNSANFVTKVTP